MSPYALSSLQRRLRPDSRHFLFLFLDRCDENAFSLSYVIDQQRAVEAQASLEAMALDDGDDALAQ